MPKKIDIIIKTDKTGPHQHPTHPAQAQWSGPGPQYLGLNKKIKKRIPLDMTKKMIKMVLLDMMKGAMLHNR